MKKLLHVGCGADRINRTTLGFNDGTWQEVRLDINELNQPDVIGSMTDMSAVDSESIDAIFSSHNIKHLYIHEIPTALAEFNRVLKQDGFCVITCPDIQTVCELVAKDKLMEAAYQSPAGPITPLDICMGIPIAFEMGTPIWRIDVDLHKARYLGLSSSLDMAQLLRSENPNRLIYGQLLARKIDLKMKCGY